MIKQVNFETAKLLREKGFDEPTIYAYKTDGTKINFNFQGGIRANVDYNSFRQNHKNPLASAPTIAEVIMWLYEKHGPYIAVDFNPENELFFYSIRRKDCRYRLNDNVSYFNSPTEAYEKAIEYCLINLI